MEYPPNPTQPFRVQTLVPALIAILTLAILQPIIVIVSTNLPMHIDNPSWRFQVFALILGAAPQIAVGLVFIAAVGLFGERYLAVRGAAVAAIFMVAVLVPLLILDCLDYFEMRRMVALDRVRMFDLTVLQAAFVGVILVPLLLWFARRALQAGKNPDAMRLEDHLVIGQEPPIG